jgi:hypothetical protein
MKLSAGKSVIKAVSLAYRSNKSVLLEGRPGVGKSCLFHAAAKELGIQAVVRDLSLIEVDPIGWTANRVEYGSGAGGPQDPHRSCAAAAAV